MAQLSYDSLMPVALEGMPGDGSLSNRIETARLAAALPKIMRITIGGATNTTAYGATINGVRVTYTSDGSATIAEIKAGLIAAINNSGFASKIVSAASSGVNTLDVTGLVTGADYTMTIEDGATGDLSLSTTQNAISTTVAFGRAVVVDSYDSTQYVRNVKLPSAAGQEFAGITCFTQKANPNATPNSQTDATGAVSYVDKDATAIMRQGLIWVRPETDVDATADSVFFRQTVAGNTEVGALTTVDDGNTDAVPTAKWRSSGVAGSLVLLEINIP